MYGMGRERAVPPLRWVRALVFKALRRSAGQSGASLPHRAPFPSRRSSALFSSGIPSAPSSQTEKRATLRPDVVAVAEENGIDEPVFGEGLFGETLIPERELDNKEKILCQIDHALGR